MVNVRSNPVLANQISRKKEFYKLCKRSSEKIGKILPKKEFNDIMLVEDKLNKLTARTVDDVRKFILLSVEEVINDTLNHYREYHEKMTGEVVPKEKLREIKGEALKQFAYHPFHGKTFDDRIANLQRKINRNIKNTLPTTVDPKELEKEIKEYFYSFSYVSGGSLRGTGETLLVSEENRFYHVSSVIFFKKVGVRFVRFCLLPNYSKDSDLIELANYSNEEVEKKYPDFDSTGIYRLDELPDFPRPRAKYYLQPVYQIGYLK